VARLHLVLALVAFPVAGQGHAILDPKQLQQALAEIASSGREARQAPADGEPLYAFGEKVEALVDLLNQDLAGHGTSDVLARLVVDRLRAYEVQVEFSEPERRYVYDLAAFREYLDRAPHGGRAPAAWFRLLAREFHRSAGAAPFRLTAADGAAVARAVAAEEQFLRRYPGDEKAREVRFFLAVDYYRLATAEGLSRRARYRRLCRDALQVVRAQAPGTLEARTAEVLLENLRRE
jgi:hypothetical protein